MILFLGRPNAEERSFIAKLKLESEDEFFLKRFFPKREINENVTILNLKRIKFEMDELNPGCFVSKLGYVPLAASYGGALYCVNGKYKNSDGLIRVSKIHADLKENYSSVDKIEDRVEFCCYGLREFFRKCFYDDSIDS